MNSATSWSRPPRSPPTKRRTPRPSTRWRSADAADPVDQGRYAVSSGEMGRPEDRISIAVARYDDVVHQRIDQRNEEHKSSDRLPPSGHNDEAGQAQDRTQPEAGQGKGFGEAVRKPKLDNARNGESLESVPAGSNLGEGIAGSSSFPFYPTSIRPALIALL